MADTAIAAAVRGDRRRSRPRPGSSATPRFGVQAELLLGLNRSLGTALVVVTHSRELAGRLARQAEMVDGHLEEGPAAEPPRAAAGAPRVGV